MSGQLRLQGLRQPLDSQRLLPQPPRMRLGPLLLVRPLRLIRRLRPRHRLLYPLLR
ncbi:MAG: hypothetical protein ACJ8BF_06570 [Gemmatimonadales bacterium]